MSVRIGSGLSTELDVREAAVEAALAARVGLAGGPADLAVVFAGGAHLADPERTLEGVFEALSPTSLIGCGSSGVVAGRREVERDTAVAVWAATLDDGSAQPFHAVAAPEPGLDAMSVTGAFGPEGEDMTVGISGLPDLDGASAAILLPDPYTFPTDAVLRELAAWAPGVPILGGVASARASDHRGALFFGEKVFDDGAVGVRLDGVELLPCVSQGATPVGPELTVTAGSGHVIEELAGRPALQKLRDVVMELPPDDRELVSRGLLLGVVVDGNKPDYVQGDFLVRGLVGADLEDGSLVVGSDVEPGQVVRLHARDADSAHRDLREALGLRRAALGGRAPAGALVFTCNGRGRSMFGAPDHDARTIGEELGDIPSAGFFAAGEIGPVGGESFLHSFTATLAVFSA